MAYKRNTSQKGVALSSVAGEVAGSTEVWGFASYEHPEVPSLEAAHAIVCISRQALQTIPSQPLLSTLHPRDCQSLWPGTHKHFPLANHSSFEEC